MKIVKIISTKQIVVNAGSKDGIKEGQQLEIIDKIGDEPVVDPESGENLGYLNISKGKVIVSRVFPKMSIAEAPSETYSVFDQLTGTFKMPSTTIQSDLNVDPKEITGGLPSPSKDPIRVGDTVIKINE